MKKMLKRLLLGSVVVIIVCLCSVILLPGLYDYNLLEHQTPLQNFSNPVQKGYDNSYFPQKYHIAASFPLATGTYPLYTITTPIRTKEDSQKIAEKFGLYCEPLPFDQNIYKDDEKTVTIDNSSLILYTNNKESERGHQPDLLPTEKDADYLAKEFLKTHHIEFPGAALYSITHEPGYGCNTTTGDCILEEDRLNIYYVHRIDGHRFLPDRLYFIMGEQGVIINLVSRWNIYEPSGEVAIISPNEAFERLQKAGIVMTVGDKDSIKEPVPITIFELAYTYPDPYEVSDTVVPVYYFAGEGEGIAWYQIIPAIADSGVSNTN